MSVRIWRRKPKVALLSFISKVRVGRFSSRKSIRVNATSCLLVPTTSFEVYSSWSSTSISQVSGVAALRASSVLFLKCRHITHAASALSRAARARVILERISAPSAFHL